MAEIKNKEDMGQKPFAIPVKNIIYIIAGFGVMVLGYLLMMGGKCSVSEELFWLLS